MRWSTPALLGFLIVSAVCFPLQAQDDYQERRQQIQREIDGLDNQIRNTQLYLTHLNSQISDLNAEQKKASNLAKTKMTEFHAASKEVETAAEPFNMAKTSAEKADQNLKETTKKIREQLESSDEMVAAKRALDTTRECQVAARTAALAALADKPEYLSATVAEKAASDRLNTLRFAKNPDQGAIARAAAELLERQKAVATFDQSVLTADPKFQEADAQYAEAAKVIGTLQAGLADKLKINPERRAAERGLEDAKGKVAELQKPLTAAIQRQSAAKTAAARAQYRSQQLSDQYTNAQRDYSSREQELRNIMSQRDRRVRDLSSLRR